MGCVFSLPEDRRDAAERLVHVCWGRDPLLPSVCLTLWTVRCFVVVLSWTTLYKLYNVGCWKLCKANETIYFTYFTFQLSGCFPSCYSCYYQNTTTSVIMPFTSCKYYRLQYIQGDFIELQNIFLVSIHPFWTILNPNHSGEFKSKFCVYLVCWFSMVRLLESLWSPGNSEEVSFVPLVFIQNTQLN